MVQLRLKPGRERSVLRRHPWIFSGAIARVEGNPDEGETVEVCGSGGQWLARAAYSPHSQIRARVWTWRRGEAIDESFFARRLEAALALRAHLAADETLTAYREVHAESDLLPGLIVDRYGEYRVVQFLTAGMERWRDVVVRLLAGRGDVIGIYERSDVGVREREGLALRRGHLWGQEPPELLQITEYGSRFYVDVRGGHKTGFYLDQRENRRLLRESLRGGRVLNCFAYTGGFTVAAQAAGASEVVSIDSSGPALALARENVKLNGLDEGRCRWREADVFRELRALRDAAEQFDAVILDPPRFAARASQAASAARGYKDINLLALRLLRPGGLLYTFSCSGGVTPELFQKIVAGAALDAGVDAQVVAWLGQPEDHPVSLAFPEGRYLKGLVCRVLGPQ